MSGTEPTVPLYYNAEQRDLIRVIIVGVSAGILIPLLGWMISTWIIDPFFCKADAGSFGVCATGGLVGYYVSAVIVSAAAVAMLASWSIYRPLIIAMGVMLGLWGLKRYLDPIAAEGWLEYYVTSGMLFGLGYVLFYWLTRVRHFGSSLALAIITVIVVRWVLIV